MSGPWIFELCAVAIEKIHSCSDERWGVLVSKILGEQTISLPRGEAAYSDVVAISAITKAIIVYLVEMEQREALGGRARAHRDRPIYQ